MALATIKVPQGYRSATELADDCGFELVVEAMDLVRNVGGFDDSLLVTSDLNLLRATLREWRDQARAILDAAPGVND